MIYNIPNTKENNFTKRDKKNWIRFIKIQRKKIYVYIYLYNISHTKINEEKNKLAEINELTIITKKFFLRKSIKNITLNL